MNNFKTIWTRTKRSVVAFAEAVEGTSSYPFDRINELQRELATAKARQDSPCEACRNGSRS